MGDFNYPEIDSKGEVVAAGDTDPPTLFFNKTQELCLFQHWGIRCNKSETKSDRKKTREELKRLLRGFKRNPKRLWLREERTTTFGKDNGELRSAQRDTNLRAGTVQPDRTF